VRSPGDGFTFFHFVRHPHQVFQGFVNLVLGGEVEGSGGGGGFTPTLHDTLVIISLMSPYELEESMTSGRFIMVTRFGRRTNPYRRFTRARNGLFTSGTIPTRKFEQFGVDTYGLFGIIAHIYQEVGLYLLLYGRFLSYLQLDEGGGGGWWRGVEV